MKKLRPNDLLKLEDYARERTDFRERIMEHKRTRSIQLGDHMTLFFEDRWTIQYQVQEMLRIEKIFEPEAIEDELAAYNPLIPDGHNWKATCMIEFEDPDERRKRLKTLRGIEDRIWVRIGNEAAVYAIADEDMDRSDQDKTSAVHFLRFELSESAIADLKHGSHIDIGVDHEAYTTSATAPESLRQALAADLRDVTVTS